MTSFFYSEINGTPRAIFKGIIRVLFMSFKNPVDFGLYIETWGVSKQKIRIFFFFFRLVGERRLGIKEFKFIEILIKK